MDSNLDHPPAMTGFWIFDHGEESAWAERGMRYEVRFAFEGEINFADMATAQLAAKGYEKIMRECADGYEQLERALAFVVRLMEIGRIPKCGHLAADALCRTCEMFQVDNCWPDDSCLTKVAADG